MEGAQSECRRAVCYQSNQRQYCMGSGDPVGASTESHTVCHVQWAIWMVIRHASSGSMVTPHVGHCPFMPTLRRRPQKPWPVDKRNPTGIIPDARKRGSWGLHHHTPTTATGVHVRDACVSATLDRTVTPTHRRSARVAFRPARHPRARPSRPDRLAPCHFYPWRKEKQKRLLHDCVSAEHGAYERV